MEDRPPVGPYKLLSAADGTEIPWYILPFDKHGRGQSPLSRQHLVAAVEDGNFTDIILFSHGWNNDWKDASERYKSFIEGYEGMRKARRLTYDRPVRPLLVGIFWPSTALVLPWEEGPQFAAGGGARDEWVELEHREVDAIASELDTAVVERFYELIQQRALSAQEVRELAAIMAPLYAAEADELAGAVPAPTAEELLEAWLAATKLDDSGDTSGEFSEPAGAADPLASAGALGILDPRTLVRAATVWQMKDRAGVVGAKGIAPLLQDLLRAGDGGARVHLIGHSYGAKVLLSALCYPDSLPRKVNSLLLLQPAVSCLCFGERATADGRPGGYRAALQRVEQPILTTFSWRDIPLRHLFHRVVRRRSDLGEARIAGAPPSRYAALGGYGPAGADQDTWESTMPAPGVPYPLGSAQRRIVALKADTFIRGHGNVSIEATWWALYCQMNDGGT